MDSKKTSLYIWPIILFIGLMTYKNYLLGYQSSLYLNIATDLLLFALICTASIQQESNTARWFQAAIASLIILYNWLDVCVILAIHDRFTINNAIANIKYFDVFPYFISSKIIIFTVGTVVFTLMFRKKTITLPYNTSTMNYFAGEVIVVLIIAYFIVSSKSQLYNEEGSINLSNNSITATSLTDATLVNAKSQSPVLLQYINDFFSGKEWMANISPSGERPNIIVVISESLTGVDSKYAGGLFDRTPMIDKIQQEGMAFKRAASNGKITSHGLAASMLAMQTNETGGYTSMLEQFPPKLFSESNVIAYAKKAGYKTIIISPGLPDSFFAMEDWFREVGFDEIYAKKAQIFSAARRFTWDSPSDEAMYNAALEMLPKQQSPYLIVMETVSLHQPYILPDIKYRIGNDDLLNQINYVDGTTYHFYEALKKQNFFNNGVFILYGDHRRFEPLEKEEIDHGGYAVWHERIICALAGKGIKPNSIIDFPFSLIDMNALMHYIIDGKYIDENTALQANLGTRLGLDTQFNVSLVDDDHGTYLVRSAKYPPMYISIYGNLDFSQIPNQDYKDITTYLIMNDFHIRQTLNSRRD